MRFAKTGNRNTLRYRGVNRTTDIPRDATQQLVAQALPQYETDDGPLTIAQIRQIKKQVRQDAKCSIKSIRPI